MVAYNFVPGGVITRERTDVLLTLLVLSCGLGTCNISYHQAEVKVPEDVPKDKAKDDQINFFGRVFRRMSTITEDTEVEEEEPFSIMQQVIIISAISD